jgi:hypothetical protein
VYYNDGLWVQLMNKYNINQALAIITRCREQRFGETGNNASKIMDSVWIEHPLCTYEPQNLCYLGTKSPSIKTSLRKHIDGACFLND